MPRSAKEEAFIAEAVEWYTKHPDREPMADELFYRNGYFTRKLLGVARARLRAQQKRALKEPPITLKSIFGNVPRAVREMRHLEFLRGDHLLRD